MNNIYIDNEYIKESAFYNNSSLENVIIEDTNIHIHDKAFMFSSISTIKLSKNTEYIGELAFATCSNLHDMRFYKGIKYLGDAMFAGCINLENVIFEGYIEYLPYRFFSNCPNLKTVTFMGGVGEINPTAFDGTNNCKVTEYYTNSESLLNLINNKVVLK
jgi:hypothetical protein